MHTERRSPSTQIIAEPLTERAFEPFGEVLAASDAPGRVFFNDALANARAGATVNLSIAKVSHTREAPFVGRMLERHEFSSQTFLPLKVSRYLVVVAPGAAGGGPDVSRVRAFLAGPRLGITYRMGTWHHGLTVLDEPAEFAVLMWCDGTSGDEEFVPLAEPFTVVLPD
jgi:ureidoglycolate lyase